ncbi:hypothetical protein J2Z69_001865 [Paenibacillus shirakamiensis]|uniref:Uncharacterized protein n=1 Tax=Paenibacillus shirakamiensis TaxID=1265935 RepID=A0ABS4JJP9_9BACL|nr:hypothetical protein [Paenibacillus shirakamiensis]MBP2000834.1 hypothetical protein [Paenibacillus shirakamiensis]
MSEFNYSCITESSINITYLYGGEYFNFNLYMKEGVWILHPFDGILLGNMEMSKLVMSDLFQNKSFQVMLAKERIPFSILRTSIDLEGHVESNHRNSSRDQSNAPDSILDFIEEHTLEEIIQLEQLELRKKISLYSSIMQHMFMNDLGPSDVEFQRIQQITRIYEKALTSMENLNGPHLDFGNQARF